MSNENTLYVGNLSYDTTDEGLKDHFSAYGKVNSVKLISDRETGQSRGFGFVEFETDEDAAAALEGTNGQNLDGRDIKVNVAQPKESRPQRKSY